ncbi:MULTISPECIES: uroporphyrinogen-III synthase [unclassified Rhodosalinus]|uniref:uroporphyrinogen-III synthase n=1 Tax=unclassified Rhodosalinus TaxID=2630183 RepID=UPI00352500D4
MPPPPVLLLTRPHDASERFATELSRILGDAAPEVCISPLMRVDFAGRLPGMADVAALVFTSANGVRAFVAAGGPRGLPAFAVGEATAEAARRAGISAQPAGGDAQALVAHVAARRPAGRIVHVRGEHARGDVAMRLRAAGLRVEEAVLYRQVLLPFTDSARRVLAGRAPVVAPLFSPRTAEQFARQHRGGAPLWLVAMSEAVAGRVSHLPARRIAVATRPDAPSMLKGVAQLIESAVRLESDEGAG